MSVFFLVLAVVVGVYVDSFKETPVSKILDVSTAICTEETHENKKQHNKDILTQKDIDGNELENSEKSEKSKNGGRKRTVKRRMRNVFVKHIPRMIHLNQAKKKKNSDYKKNKNQC